MVLLDIYIFSQCYYIMSAQFSCSFYTLCNSSCGLSSKSPKLRTCVPLLSCSRNISSHLKSINVSTSCVSTESELILSRCPVSETLELYSICPRHRDELGLYWRPVKRCKHPLHGTSARKPDRAINLKVSQEIFSRWNIHLPIGTGKNRVCCLMNYVFILYIIEKTFYILYIIKTVHSSVIAKLWFLHLVIR